MWLGWLVVCAALGARRQRRRRERVGRAVVAAATPVMLVVYLVPRSFRGSELDYDQLDKGADPAEAIQTG